MTQASLFWTTSGSGDGAVSGYSPEQLWTLLRALFGGDGVLSAYQDALLPAIDGSNVTVQPGAALVAGIPYVNDAEITISVPASTAENRIDRIVLRANWQAQTVRAVRLAGTEGSLTPTALTQQRGGTYEIELAQVGVGVERVISANTTETGTMYVASLEVSNGYYLEIANGGQVVIEDIAGLTDGRTYLQTVRPGGIDSAQIADDAVGAAVLVDGAVTNAKLANMAQATVKGRASSGSGAPQDLSAAQLLALAATTTPDRLVDANTTLSTDTTTEWLEVATGYYLEVAAGVALTLGDGGWTGLDGDTVDGSAGSAFSASSHAHDYAAGSHAHDYAASSHAHSTYSALAHGHSGYSAASHSHSYAAASHSHGTDQIADGAVTNAKLADMAEARVKGRAHNVATGDPVDLSAAQVVAILSTLNGVAGGLDGDLLDGVSSSDLADSDHAHVAYADISHTHISYAALSHTHISYATLAHTHSTYSAASHTHDYSAASHTHDYSAASHTHSYSALAHSHSYAAASHSHSYAAASHTHSYSAASHTHSYAPLGHAHGSRVYTYPTLAAGVGGLISQLQVGRFVLVTGQLSFVPSITVPAVMRISTTPLPAVLGGMTPFAISHITGQSGGMFAESATFVRFSIGTYTVPPVTYENVLLMHAYPSGATINYATSFSFTLVYISAS